MKNIKVLLMATFLTGWQTTQGQKVFPTTSTDPSWDVLECFWANCQTKTYQYSYDTTYCSQTYSRISGSEFTGYLRADSSRAFFRKTVNCSDKEYLIYDYTLGVGDSAYVGYDLGSGEQNDTSAFLVQEIDTVNYFGIDRQRYRVKYDRCNQSEVYSEMYWIKGIGSTTHPFYSLLCLCDGCENGYTLLCHDSVATQLYQNTTYNTCDTTITVGIDAKADHEKVEIYPNPFQFAAFIDLKGMKEADIYLYTINGKLISSFHSEKQKYIGQELQPGVYMLTIQTDQIVIRRKLIKIE